MNKSGERPFRFNRTEQQKKRSHCISNSQKHFVGPFFRHAKFDKFVSQVKGFEKITISFWQAFNLDTTIDYGSRKWQSMCSFEYRNAGSFAWIMMGYIGNPDSYNWYNYAKGGCHGWAYLDSSWFYSSFEHYHLNSGLLTDSLQFRFIFKTYHNNYVNFNATGDGWAIDDFQINGHYYSNELALKKIIKPVNNSYGMDTVKIRIVNLGSVPYKPISISYRVGTNTAVTESFTGNPIPPGDSLDYAFNTLLSLPQSNFNICTYLTTYDTYKGNDTLCSSIITTDIFSSESFYINSISPNPVKDVAQIYFNLEKGQNIHFMLYNASGAIVYKISSHLLYFEMHVLHLLVVHIDHLLDSILFVVVLK